jgi:hypothetical protein
MTTTSCPLFGYESSIPPDCPNKSQVDSTRAGSRSAHMNEQPLGVPHRFNCKTKFRSSTATVPLPLRVVKLVQDLQGLLCLLLATFKKARIESGVPLSSITFTHVLPHQVGSIIGVAYSGNRARCCTPGVEPRDLDLPVLRATPLGSVTNYAYSQNSISPRLLRGYSLAVRSHRAT